MYRKVDERPGSQKSWQIVNFAIENSVSVIRLKNLTNIRNTTRKSRKNVKNLYTWHFIVLQYNRI